MKKIFTVCLFICFVGSINAQNYNKEFVKQVKKLIGKDVKKYNFLSYPVDNFGALTCYKTAATDDNQLCASFRCIGQKKPANAHEWLSLYDYVDVGQGGTINLSNKSQKEIAVKTLLPKIYQAVDLNGKFDKRKIITTTVTINSGYRRIIVPDSMLTRINSLNNTVPLKVAYTNNELVYVYADFVIDKMTVRVDIEQSAATELDAKLQLGQSITSKSVEDERIGLSLTIKKESAGSYVITFDKPVVIARLIKAQPTQGGLSAADETFVTTNITDPSLIR